MKIVTILFLRREGQILLAMKKRGFGVNKWNGVGGKVEPGETITEGVLRECHEEIGVVAHDPKLVGTIQFFDPSDEGFHHNCHIFVAESWEGEPQETEEMRPQWFNESDIPYTEMWPDDEVWLPMLLAGQLFEGTVWVTDTELIKHDLHPVNVVHEQIDPLKT